jgi:hypothetical protein
MMVLPKRISLPSILNRKIVEEEEEEKKTTKHVLLGGQTKRKAYKSRRCQSVE